MGPILVWCTILLVFVIVGTVSGAPPTTPAFNSEQQQQQQKQQPKQQKQPNFVIILTDDLDWTLGGTHASTLRRTRTLIGEQGKTFTNWFVQTPVCCPSRAELLTGKMNHNLRLPDGGYSSSLVEDADDNSTTSGARGCMHIDVSSNASHPFYQRDYFAQYFQQLNYTVGIFGKHLNNANPTDFLPEGVDEMLINGGGVYLDPTFTVGTRGTATKPRSVTFDNCTATTGMPCYSTSIIGNSSLAWIRRHTTETQNSKPFLALISVKAPHILDGPDFPRSVPAPWYEHTTIPEEFAPRTPNYNYSAPDHHWLVRNQLPLTKEEATQVDALYVSRLKTLLSVDDLVEDLLTQLQKSEDDNNNNNNNKALLDNTYIIFTSDNGYRLGQFRMPMCKLHPYENDIRVPFMIRGPHIRPNTTSSLLSSHVNLMPTLLGLASNTSDSSAVPPSTMDGTNLASCIVDKDDEENLGDPRLNNNNNNNCSAVSRHSSLLIEYLSLGNVVRYNHTIDTYNHSFLALRMIQTHDEDDENGDNSGDHDSTKSHWMYSFDFPEQKETGTPWTGRRSRSGSRVPASSSTSTSTSSSTPPRQDSHLLQNLKYMEYRDSRYDWNATRPPLEQELFDLDRDPYELHNLISHDVISPLLIQALQWKLQRLFHCQGDTCRLEHNKKVKISTDLWQSVEITT